MDKQYELIAVTAFMEHIQKELDYVMRNHWPRELIEQAGVDAEYLDYTLMDIEHGIKDVITTLNEVRHQLT